MAELDNIDINSWGTAIKKRSRKPTPKPDDDELELDDEPSAPKPEFTDLERSDLFDAVSQWLSAYKRDATKKPTGKIARQYRRMQALMRKLIPEIEKTDDENHDSEE